jgi:hypothetical protein
VGPAARYRLLKANKEEAVRSGKEAFCLAPTDSIDLTVRGANWKPGSTGLATACGGDADGGGGQVSQFGPHRPVGWPIRRTTPA